MTIYMRIARGTCIGPKPQLMLHKHRRAICESATREQIAQGTPGKLLVDSRRDQHLLVTIQRTLLTKHKACCLFLDAMDSMDSSSVLMLPHKLLRSAFTQRQNASQSATSFSLPAYL